MHARRERDIDADVNIGKLRIDQRVDADAANSRLEAAGGRRLAIADVEGRLHVVDRAELRRLENLRVDVVESRLKQGAGKNNGVIRTGNVPEVGDRDGQGSGGSRGRTWSRAGVCLRFGGRNGRGIGDESWPRREDGG